MRSVKPDFILAVPTLGTGGLVFRFLNSVNYATKRRYWLMLDSTPGRCVAAKWNRAVEAMMIHDLPLVVANDDIILWPGALDQLVSTAFSGDLACGITTTNKPIEGDSPLYKPGTEGGFSLFAITPKLIEAMQDHERQWGDALGHQAGRFDEGFFPAYFEDSDFYYRLKLAGRRERVVSAHYYHETTPVGGAVCQGATTTLRDPTRKAQHRRNMTRNRQRYIEKWGGEPHHEKFDTPWGSGE